MEKTGTGTLVLTGENTYRGATSVREGTLQVGDGGRTGSILSMADSSLSLTVASGAALAFNRSDDIHYQGTAAGEGRLIQRGAGTLLVTGAPPILWRTTSWEKARWSSTFRKTASRKMAVRCNSPSAAVPQIWEKDSPEPWKCGVRPMWLTNKWNGS